MRFDKESLMDVKSVVEASYGLQIELAGLYDMRRGDIPIWYRGTSKTSHFPIPSLGSVVKSKINCLVSAEGMK